MAKGCEADDITELAMDYYDKSLKMYEVLGRKELDPEIAMVLNNKGILLVS